MRTGSSLVAIIVSAIILSASPTTAQITDPGAPGYTNNILGGFVTPTVAPGKTVNFAFNLSNPYSGDGISMHDIEITVAIYEYATEEKVVKVDGAFPHPPLINGNATEKRIEIRLLELGKDITLTLPIETSKKTPHGSYFSQSTYFVSFNMTFMMDGFDDPIVLKSRGCFSDEQWSRIVSFEGNESIVNRTYLKELGVDGLLPDSSFGMKIPIPRWPLALIVIGAAGLALAAGYYFVLDNPGKYPKLEKRLYQLRGKLSELRGKLKDRGGK